MDKGGLLYFVKMREIGKKLGNWLHIGSDKPALLVTVLPCYLMSHVNESSDSYLSIRFPILPVEPIMSFVAFLPLQCRIQFRVGHCIYLQFFL